MSITPQKRSSLIHLINTSNPFSSTSAVWSLVNEGVTELTENFNADTEDLQYIAEDQATSVVKKYAPSIELTAVLLKGDAVNTWIRRIVNTLPVFEDADTEYIRYNLLDEKTGASGSNKQYAAIKKKAVVSVSNIGGGAGENIEMSVTLSGQGDPIPGIVTVTTTGTGAEKKTEYTFTQDDDAFKNVYTTASLSLDDGFRIK